MDYALPNALVVDSAAIVFDFNKNVISAVVGANRNVSFVGFASGLAKFRALDTARYGVSNQVNQRGGNVLDDVVVELGLRALEHKLYGFS